MEIITSLLEGFDLNKIIPDLSTFLGKLQMVASIAVMVGPIVMLLSGVWFWLHPPKEANHKAGFRTYFGMGSVEAWTFTQGLAGKVWTVLGGLLTIICGIFCVTFGGKEIGQVVNTAVVLLLIQAGLAFLAWLSVTVIVTVTFNRNGKRRKKSSRADFA